MGRRGGRGGQLAKTWVAWTGRVKKTLLRKQGWGTRRVRRCNPLKTDSEWGHRGECQAPALYPTPNPSQAHPGPLQLRPQTPATCTSPGPLAEEVQIPQSPVKKRSVPEVAGLVSADAY